MEMKNLPSGGVNRPETNEPSEPRRGLFIVFEGIDGSGKSTQIDRLTTHLRGQGHSVAALKEPTDGPCGKRLRALAARGRDENSPEQECELFLMDRREDVEKNILPALEAGQIILMDRYYFSTMAYQGALGLDVNSIRRDNEAFAPLPDLVLYLRVPLDVALHRIEKGRKESPNLFEKRDYLARVSEIFQTFHFPFWKIIDASEKADKVFDQILVALSPLLQNETRE